MKGYLKRNAIIVITILSIILLACWYYFDSIIPRKVVSYYLNKRYSGTNSSNIQDRIQIQKKLLDRTLIDSEFKFANFQDELEYFKKNKYYTEIRKIEIGKTKNKKGLKKVPVIIDINIYSEKSKFWNQITKYRLNFTLKRTNWKEFIISYIEVIDMNIIINDSTNY